MQHAGAELFGNVAVEGKVHILWGNNVNCTDYEPTVVKTSNVAICNNIVFASKQIINKRLTSVLPHSSFSPMEQ